MTSRIEKELMHLTNMNYQNQNSKWPLALTFWVDFMPNHDLTVRFTVRESRIQNRPFAFIFRNCFGHLVSACESNEQERNQVVRLLLSFEIAISRSSPISQNGFYGLLYACKDWIRDNDSIWFNKSIAMVTFLIRLPCKLPFYLSISHEIDQNLILFYFRAFCYWKVLPTSSLGMRPVEFISKLPSFMNG